jgi:hypothetical protein
MREIKTALEHGEDPGDVIPWCLEHSKKAIKDYEGSGGIK